MVTSPSTTDAAAVPRHVAVIMDANGRWAAERGLSRSAGHRAGTENIRHVIKAFGDRGVACLTLFAFSTENWRRPRAEVRGLMTILSRTIRREVKPLHEAGIRIRYIGRLDGLSANLRRHIEDAVELTKNNREMTVCIAFNYGGRAEVVDAIRRIVAEGLPPDEIDERTVASRLYTDGLPDPDLVIRTGGDLRLSNFLLWQSAYAEYHFTATYWPDFGDADVEEALESYARRVRNFGGRPTRAGRHKRNGRR